MKSKHNILIKIENMCYTIGKKWYTLFLWGLIIGTLNSKVLMPIETNNSITWFLKWALIIALYGLFLRTYFYYTHFKSQIAEKSIEDYRNSK